MFFRTRLVAAACIAALGTGLAMYALIQGNYWSAISAMILGFIVGLVCLGGREVMDHPVVSTSIAAAGFFGIVAVFTEHRAFDFNLAHARADAFVALSKGPGCLGVPDASALFQKALTACAIQDKLDSMDVAAELQKAVHLGPKASLIDQTNSALSVKKADACAETFRLVESRCPEAFVGMDEHARTFLRQSK